MVDYEALVRGRAVGVDQAKGAQAAGAGPDPPASSVPKVSSLFDEVLAVA